MKLGQLWLACGIACLIVAGVKADRALFQVPAASSVEYHANIRKFLEPDKLPTQIGEWTSRTVDVPTGAQKLLRSNALVSLEYSNPKMGQVSFLLVQCGDARDLSGHWPPNCYPSAGYTQASSYETSGEISEPGTMYNFKQSTLNGTKSIWVYNLMVLPDNRTARGMDGVYRIARNRTMRYFGAAEIQVLTDDKFTPEERSKIVNMLLAAYKPMIQAIRSGVADEHH
jgi:hypothetical protein